MAAILVSVLGSLRRYGVEIALSGQNLAVEKASPAQLDEIRERKPEIVAALVSEGILGADWQHSALLAGIQETYRQASQAYEMGIAPKECEALIASLDGILSCPYEDGVRTYLSWEESIKTLVTAINNERRLMLEGLELERAAVHVFGQKRAAPKPVFDSRRGI